jgi:hypothetical protein
MGRTAFSVQLFASLWSLMKELIANAPTRSANLLRPHRNASIDLYLTDSSATRCSLNQLSTELSSASTLFPVRFPASLEPAHQNHDLSLRPSSRPRKDFHVLSRPRKLFDFSTQAHKRTARLEKDRQRIAIASPVVLQMSCSIPSHLHTRALLVFSLWPVGFHSISIVHSIKHPP